MKNIPKQYEVGDDEIHLLINKLVERSASTETRSVFREIFTTVVKLGIESKDKVDINLLNNVLKEFRYSFKVFSKYRNTKKVIIFGSARSKKTSAEYRMADSFARTITRKGYMVVTGGGPGVMEAGNKGAERGKDFALNIRLPFEQKPNPYMDEKERLINYKYFFTRKLFFMKETDATTLFPGGFGTNDEGFEALTLIQTGKSMPRPIVLMEPEGSTYWASWKRFINNQLVKKGYVNKEDMKLFYIAGDVNEAVSYIEEFYKIYHSVRYLGDLTIIRLKEMIPTRDIELLNREFKDILSSGKIEVSQPAKVERERGEYLDLPRLSMKFNRRDYGRLCEMIRVINKANNRGQASSDIKIT